MTTEKIAQLIAEGVEGDYPAAAVEAHVGSNPTEIWVEATDNDGVTHTFRLTVEAQS
ncbi:hypothetical protein AB0J77_14595 [Micromonospora tulbaghiae]|uniref:hypothetical protein n=1 Tax=Micromonospora tulbaghiae TaxID=479978 RepID=UPI00342B9505